MRTVASTSELALHPPLGEGVTLRDEDAEFERYARGIISLLGEDPKREGLAETPRRLREAWREWVSGYQVEPASLLKTFREADADRGALVVLRSIPLYSHCEHHLTPFFGCAHVGYVPKGRIVGLSKIVRLVDAFARRLQVQERITQQIAMTIDEVLRPEGVGVVVECRHLCIESRGVRSSGSMTTTTAFRGSLRESVDARLDFMARLRPERTRKDDHDFPADPA